VEQAGFKPTNSLVLTRDINMKKKGLSEDIGKDIKGVMDTSLTTKLSRLKS